MIDPSLALTDDGIALFEDEATARELAVSLAFYDALGDESRWVELGAFGVEVDADRIGRLRELIASDLVEKFSYREELESLTNESRVILSALLEDGEGLGDAAADQWVFLVSRSWLLDKAGRFLERVGRAGARVWELTADQMRRLAEFLGSAAQTVASGLKTPGRVIKLVVEAGGPLLPAALNSLGIHHVDPLMLQVIGNGAAVVVEYDP